MTNFRFARECSLCGGPCVPAFTVCAACLYEADMEAEAEECEWEAWADEPGILVRARVTTQAHMASRSIYSRVWAVMEADARRMRG